MKGAARARRRRSAVVGARVERAARRALRALGRPRGRVEILLVEDREIRRLNRTWRGVARRTDVLAFPLELPGAPDPLVGQVVISAETARRQARRLRVPARLELELLVTHGVLHAVGWDDRDPVEAALMHAREREILEAGGRRPPERLWHGLLA